MMKLKLLWIVTQQNACFLLEIAHFVLLIVKKLEEIKSLNLVVL